jgi:hypothetical protein
MILHGFVSGYHELFIECGNSGDHWPLFTHCFDKNWR